MATAKRIRCLCGKVYDPAEHARCPACGVEVCVEKISVIAPQKSGETGEDAAGQTGATSSTGGTVTPAPVPPPAKDVRWAWVIGGAVVVSALILGLLLKPDPVPPGGTPLTSRTKEKGKGDGDAKDGEKPREESKVGDGKSGSKGENTVVHNDDGNSNDSDSKKSSGLEPEDKKGPKATDGDGKSPSGFSYAGKKHAVTAKGTPAENGKALEDAIAGAADGDTVKVGKGEYLVSGIEIRRAIRVSGEYDGKTSPIPPAVRCNSEQKPPFRVLAKGVTLENLLVLQDGAKMPAMHLTKESETDLIGCLLTSSSNIVLNAQLATSVYAENCGIGNLSGNFADSIDAVLLGKSVDGKPGLKFKFIKTEFASGGTGLRLSDAAGELHACKFKDIGAKNGRGATIFVAHGSSIVGDQCEFIKNRAGIEVVAGTAEFNGGSFMENGVVTEAQDKLTPPAARAFSPARLTFSGVAFKGNRQGVAAALGGTVTLTDCTFEDHGVAAKDNENQLFTNALCAAGFNEKSRQPSTITVSGTKFTRSNSRVAAVTDGAQLTMENCEASSGKMDSVTVGGSAPCTATLKKCQFSGFSGALVVSAGGAALLEDSEIRQNKLGIEVRESGTGAQLTNTTVAGNELFGMAVYGGAEVTARDCTFEGNGYGGVQAGLPGKQDTGSAVVVNNCKFLNNQRMNARACPNARIIIKNALFAEGAQPMIFQDQGGVVQSDPPLSVIANNNQQGPTVVPLPPKRTASNERVPNRVQPQRPPPSRQQPATPAGKVNEVLDVIDRVRRMVR